MSVVGFDVGDHTLVAAVARQGGTDVILNCAATISLTRNARLIGVHPDASSSGAFFSGVKRLLLTTGRSAQLLRDIGRPPFSVFTHDDGAEPMVPADHIGHRIMLCPVHLVAMLLSHLKRLAETEVRNTVEECVISIPSYSTHAQRCAYLDAATIAGLRPLCLMHDLAATALEYGFLRSDLAVAGDSTHVAFVNVGHCGTQVAVVSFHASGMKMLSYGFDGDLGGRDFDEVLFKHFVEKFKVDLVGDPDRSTKLRAECEKAKKTLSKDMKANVKLDGLMPGRNVIGVITRKEFENLCGSLLERIVMPCKKALVQSRVELEKLHAVELNGSGSLVPGISRAIAGFFKRDPRCTLNAAECVARGCILQAKLLSPTSTGLAYEVQDISPASIGFHISEHPMSSSFLFHKGQPMPSLKVITLQMNCSFTLDVFYLDEHDLPPGTSTSIGRFQIGPFESQTKNSIVKVSFQLNLNGIVSVTSATLINDDRMDSNSIGYMEDDSPHGMDLPIVAYLYGAMNDKELKEAQVREQELATLDKPQEVKDVLKGNRKFVNDPTREEINLQHSEEWPHEALDYDTEETHKLEKPIKSAALFEEENQAEYFRNCFQKSEIENAKLKKELKEAHDLLKTQKREAEKENAKLLKQIKEASHALKSQKKAAKEEKIKLRNKMKQASGCRQVRDDEPNIRDKIACCHDVILCENEANAAGVVELLADPKSKVLIEVQIPGIAPDVVTKILEKLERLSPLGKLLFMGMIDDIYRLHMERLSLDGNFTLEDFFWLPNKRVKLSPEVKCRILKRRPSRMNNDYKRLCKIMKKILSKTGIKIPADLKYLLDLMNSDDAADKAVLIRYNICLMDEILKKSYTVIMYDRLCQLNKEDNEQFGDRDKSQWRSTVVHSYLSVASGDWYTRMHDNTYVKLICGTSSLHRGNVTFSKPEKCLKLLRDNLTHLPGEAFCFGKIQFTDKDCVGMIEFLLPGIFSQFQEGMYAIKQLAYPHLIRVMSA